jgi:ribosome-binding protein aMBF1 (putative translation factor)
MLALTKKRHTENGHSVDDESIDWRELFGEYEDHELQGAALRGARTKEGLTQKQLSELASIPQGHLSEMENGKRPIGVVIAKKLGKALNISYKVFL